MRKNNKPPRIDDYLKSHKHHLRKSGGSRKALHVRKHSIEPLVTIFTIVKNQKKILPRAINSILKQDYKNIEYIVVDGASTDGTIEVLVEYDASINLWISEPDRGTSDATNKAISLAQGEIVFWLSADDWIPKDFISIAVKSLINTRTEFVFGDMAMYSNGAQVALIKADKCYSRNLESGNPRFNFPCMVIRKDCFQKTGLLDLNYKYSNDYEWFLRLYRQNINGYCDNSLIVHREIGGIADRHAIGSAFEMIRIMVKYKIPVRKENVIHFCKLLRIGMANTIKFLK